MEGPRPVISFRDYVAEKFFAAQRNALVEACDRVGKPRSVSYSLAGIGFTIHSVGSLMEERWFRAIKHLQIPEAIPGSWEIYAWDDAEADWTWRVPEPDYFVRMHTNHLPGISSGDIRVFYQDWLDIYSAVNRETREAFYVPANTKEMPTCERAAPMRTILNFMLNEVQYQMVHAACIASRNGQSILLPGEGGSGKSTTSIRWLLEGNSFQGDDLCAIGGEEKLETLTIYQSAKLRAASLPFFKSLHPHLEAIEELGEEKSLLYLDDLNSDRLVPGAAPIEILLPKVGRKKETELTPAKPLDVMRAIVPQSTLQVPKSDNRGGRILLDAISRLPARHLHLGTDPGQLLSTLEGVFKEHE